MVKGARICLIAVVYYAAIVRLSASNGLENQIKKLIFNNNGLGSYSFEFQNEDGTFRKEDGGIISHPSGSQSLVVRGEYGYLDPQGLYHYVNEDVELRRIFPNDFPQDTICSIDSDRYAPEEEEYMISETGSHVDRRRVYCFMLLCFTEDELDRVVASF
ncbi:unnamed protein product, partial [Brenthis ino]